MTDRDELKAKIENGFRVEKEGMFYDIGIAEGGERVCAWRDGVGDDERAEVVFGPTDYFNGTPTADAVERVAEWLP